MKVVNQVKHGCREYRETLCSPLKIYPCLFGLVKIRILNIVNHALRGVAIETHLKTFSGHNNSKFSKNIPSFLSILTANGNCSRKVFKYIPAVIRGKNMVAGESRAGKPLSL